MKKEPEVLLSHLQQRHQNLDQELDALMNQPRLTPQEYQHARELKKKKLLAKDSITALRQVLISV
jgi:hypothetical protein